jgi:hypothetical protein
MNKRGGYPARPVLSNGFEDPAQAIAKLLQQGADLMHDQRGSSSTPAGSSGR